MKHFREFLAFIKEQGVVGLAVGFILGGAVAKVVSSLVDDIINPLLGLALGADTALKEAYFEVGTVKVLWGKFLTTTLDFLIIALVIYFVVRALGLCESGKKCGS